MDTGPTWIRTSPPVAIDNKSFVVATCTYSKLEWENTKIIDYKYPGIWTCDVYEKEWQHLWNYDKCSPVVAYI